MSDLKPIISAYLAGAKIVSCGYNKVGGPSQVIEMPDGTQKYMDMLTVCKELTEREVVLVETLQYIASVTNGRIMDDYNTANDAVNLAQATLKSLGIEGEG